MIWSGWRNGVFGKDNTLLTSKGDRDLSCTNKNDLSEHSSLERVVQSVYDFFQHIFRIE